MALLDQLNTDMKVAMKAKDKFKLSVIRMLKAAVQNAEINKGSALSEDEEIELFGEVEPSVYLIEEDFYDDEPIIKANFKAIFYNELDAVSETDDDYPSIDLETFMTWFDVKLGSSVFDAQSSDLKRD